MSLVAFKYMLNTRDSLGGVNSNPADAVFQLPSTIVTDHYSFQVALESVYIPNMQTPINSYYNTLYYSEASTPSTIRIATIPSGVYNGSSFAAALQTALLASGTYPYTVSFNSITYKITITTGLLPNTITVHTGAQTMHEQAGLSLGLSQNVMEGTSPVNLSGPLFLDMQASFNSNSAHSGGKSGVFARIPLSVPFGSIEYHSPHDMQYFKADLSELQSVYVQLYDDRGRLLQLPPNAHVSYVFNVKSQGDL